MKLPSSPLQYPLPIHAPRPAPTMPPTAPPPTLTGTASCTAGSAVGCAPDAVFKQAFGVYRAVVDAGLLGHATLVGAAVGELRAVQGAAFGGAPLTILDAGCGDAGALAAGLARAGGRALVGTYHGLDASAPALAAAQPAVQAALGPGGTVATAVGDLLAHLEGAARSRSGSGGDDKDGGGPLLLPPSVACMPPPPGGYHAILATLAVHHLASPEKQRWLAAAAACLAPGGVLVVGDFFLEEGGGGGEVGAAGACAGGGAGGGGPDTVAAWRARCTARMRLTWPAVCGLPQAECDALAAHVAACDMPEAVSTFRDWMEAGAGLTRVGVAARVDAGDCGGAVIPCTTVVGHKARE